MIWFIIVGPTSITASRPPKPWNTASTARTSQTDLVATATEQLQTLIFIITHVDGSRGGLGFHRRLSVCFSAQYLKNDVDRIIKPDT